MILRGFFVALKLKDKFDLKAFVPATIFFPLVKLIQANVANKLLHMHLDTAAVRIVLLCLEICSNMQMSG